ncbi:hypothetical protein UFOVP678_52 [uncultured Caudovirales phage]|uniref:Uncharacterized protein n=1 Tax=uncultured Caudovirales phage TaxID=2100421 RepID=A0A6J5NK77_9CAUD|nr:hypothetical protein UFOVP678_52 [uncultured Caudovirales phage]
MATTTYLQAVNSVLRRLRENEVSTVNETAYSKMVGELINDAKSSVEAAYGWNALTQTLTATTTPNIFSYVLTGSGVRFRVVNVINDTTNTFIRLAPVDFMTQQFLPTTPQTGAPNYYIFNGQDANGDSLVDVFPIPDAAYDIRFNVILPQDPLTNDNTIIKVPADIVILNAYARAVVERGEDGGLQSSEAYALARNLMADYVSLESNRSIDDTNWVPS